jgi:hypothetical protein
MRTLVGMYTVFFEEDGETILAFTTGATNEDDARAQCDAFFRDNPEHGPPRGDDVTVRVERTKLPPSDHRNNSD